MMRNREEEKIEKRREKRRDKKKNIEETKERTKTPKKRKKKWILSVKRNKDIQIAKVSGKGMKTKYIEII